MMCVLVLVLVLFPDSALDCLWRFNPEARPAFQSLGSWSSVVMLTVGITCLFAAVGSDPEMGPRALALEQKADSLLFEPEL